MRKYNHQTKCSQSLVATTYAMAIETKATFRVTQWYLTKMVTKLWSSWTQCWSKTTFSFWKWDISCDNH